MQPVLITIPGRDEMLQAFMAADASYDGVFVAGVRTTGIFCRPSCSARKPLATNLEFFEAPGQALVAGYRPCKRCRPLDTGSGAPDWVARLLEATEADPEKRWTDAELQAFGLHPATVRRYFSDRFGMTFHAYARARRMASAFTKLQEGEAIDDVVFDSGYESHSGFREAFMRAFGHTPGAVAGADCVRVTPVETPIGTMIAGATTTGICLLEFSDRRVLEQQFRAIQRRFAAPVVPGEAPLFDRLRDELGRYFARDLRSFSLPLETSGTPFQELVWRNLQTIPYGEVWSYEQLAVQAGNPAAVRAVARANGANRIAILIPCHRVVNKSGQMGGYGGGVWRKTALLEIERGSR